MGNLISTIFSGFGNILSKIFGSPVDFLSGKSCNSVCGSTWDVMCYIENFCVAHLAKMAMVLVLSYMVLLFFYLLYKLRICKCICCSICKIIWALLVSWFSLWEYCCTCLCVGLMKLKRTRGKRRRRIREELDASDDEYYDESFRDDWSRRNRPLSRRSIDYREVHMRKSLRPRSHRVRVGISGDSVHRHRRKHSRKHHGSDSPVHDHIRVTQASKYVRKGRKHRGTVGKSSQSTQKSYI